MGTSLPKALPSTRVDVLDSVRPAPAKAALKVNDSQFALTAVVSDSIRSVTTQKAAAIDMEIDEGQLSRELQSGRLTLARLERLGPDVAAEIGRRLLEQYGPLATPHARARQTVRAIRKALDDLDQYLEHVE